MKMRILSLLLRFSFACPYHVTWTDASSLWILPSSMFCHDWGRRGWAFCARDPAYSSWDSALWVDCVAFFGQGIWNESASYGLEIWNGTFVLEIWSGIFSFALGIWNETVSSVLETWNVIFFVLEIWNGTFFCVLGIWNEVFFFVEIWNKTSSFSEQGIWNETSSFVLEFWNVISACGLGTWNETSSSVLETWTGTFSSGLETWNGTSFSGLGTWNETSCAEESSCCASCSTTESLWNASDVCGQRDSSVPTPPGSSGGDLCPSSSPSPHLHFSSSLTSCSSQGCQERTSCLWGSPSAAAVPSGKEGEGTPCVPCSCWPGRNF